MSHLWSTDGIAIPEQLVEAFERDEVVFFCGAGVSMPDPSNLPSFAKLTQDIVDELGQPIQVDRSSQLDVVLGNMDRLGGRVHLRASAHLSGAVLPNDVHRNVLAVAGITTTRIVTTNFDLLFEKAAYEGGITLPVFTAPALPHGDEFSGLVHLHGRIPPTENESIVLTDTDFGEAYITRAWATRFLTDMFSKYTVVFVGYSAQDTVMRYLTRAINNRDSIYAIDEDVDPNSDEHGRWDALGVTAIRYPNLDKAYSALPTLFGKWARRANQTAVGRFEAAKAIAANLPEGTSAIGEFEWVLGDVELLGHFLTHADSLKWLPWLLENGHLNTWFEASVVGSMQSRWAANSIRSDGGEMLARTLAKLGRKLNADLWFSVWQVLLGEYPGGIPARHLLGLLINHSEGQADRLAMLLRVVAPVDGAASALLLHAEITARMTIETPPNFFGDPKPEFRWTFTGGHFGGEKSGLPVVELLPDATRSLNHFLALVADIEGDSAVLRGRGRHDEISSTRRYINTDNRNNKSNPANRLIDVTRDLLRQEVHRFGIEISVRLLEHPSTLTRRLAIDALSSAPETESDFVVDGICKASLLFSAAEQGEVFRALSLHYSSASVLVRTAFVRSILRMATAANGAVITAWDRLSVLDWIAKSVPGDEQILDALSQIKAANPTLSAPEENDSRFHFGTGQDDEAYVLVGLFDISSPQQVVEALQASRSDPSRSNFRNLLAETVAMVERRPDLTSQLLNECVVQQLWDTQLWIALIRAVAQCPSGSWLESLPEQVAANPARYGLTFVLEEVLFEGAGNGAVRPRELQRRIVASGEIWKTMTHPQDLPASDSGHWTPATPRRISARTCVQLIVRAIERRTSHRLTPRERNLLTQMAATTTDDGDETLTEVLQESRNWLVSDPAWFDTVALPHFRLDVSTSRFAWAGLLRGNQWSIQMHERLSEPLRVMLPWVHENLPDQVQHYSKFHAQVFMSFVGLDDLAWADAFYVRSTPAERADWLVDIVEAVGFHPGPELESKMWTYWQRRLAGLPAAVTGAEQAVLVEWVDPKSSYFAEMVRCFVSGPPPRRTAGDRLEYYDYPDLPTEAHPIASAEMMLHLLTSSLNLPAYADNLATHAVKIASLNRDLASSLLSELLRRQHRTAGDQLEALLREEIR